MMPWFFPATAALAFPLLLLQGAFLWLAGQKRHPFFRFLTCGWALLLLHLLLEFASLIEPSELLITLASRLSFALGLVLLLQSCRFLLDRPVSGWTAALLVSGFSLWLIPSHLLLDSRLLIEAPTSFFFAILLLLAAGHLYQATGANPDLKPLPAALTMAVWAAFFIASPFILSPLHFGASLGNALLMLLTGLALLPICLGLWIRRAHAFGERCRTLFTEGQDAMFVYRLNSSGSPDCPLEVNNAACRLLGYPREELLHRSLRQITAPDYFDNQRALLEALSTSDSAHFPWQLVSKTGAIIPVEVSAHRFSLNGEPAIMASARNLSEQQRARDELVLSHQRLLRVLDSLDSLVYVAEMDTYEILYANRAVLREFGDAMGKRCWQVFHHGRQTPCAFCPGKELLNPAGMPAEPRSHEVRNPITGKWYHITSKAIEWQDSRLVRFEIATDITDRIEAEQGREREMSIRSAISMASEALLAEPLSLPAVATIILPQARKLTASEHGVVGIVTPEGSLDIVAHTGMMAACTDHGRRSPLPAARRGLWGQALDTGRSFFTNAPAGHLVTEEMPDVPLEITNFLAVPLTLADGVVGEIALANSSQGYTEVDIATVERLGQILALAIQRQRVQQERERLITELRQSQKMEAIGTLAGGIAHDFNNILSTILGYAELTQFALSAENPAASNLQQIIEGCRRATELIGQLQAFSRSFGEEKRPLALQFVLKESLKLLRATIPSTIQFREEIDIDCSPILGDIAALHQIVINLCTNAYQAMMPEGGLLGVSLRETEVTVANASDYPALATGPYVKLIIQDTGRGMDQATLKRIFDPSFTTRRQSGGSGLGLATVRHLVASLGGAITVQSEPGLGSTFEVLFPALPRQLENKQPARPRLPRFHASVLFVDDDLSITTLGRTLLETMGCTVKTFSSSVAALACFTASPSGFDLVITDQTMPELTGFDLAKQLLAIRPDLPVILATGYSETISAETAAKAGIAEYMLKPLSLEKLAACLTRLLPKETQGE
ncbi:MAG: ATP-binding protein [Thermodesulfobacteriota bacterium]